MKKIKAWILRPKGKTDFDASLVTTQWIVSEWHKSHVIDTDVVEVEIVPLTKKKRK